MPNQAKIFLGKSNLTAKVLAAKFVGLSTLHGSLFPPLLQIIIFRNF
jgi:hypothetical protein